MTTKMKLDNGGISLQSNLIGSLSWKSSYIQKENSFNYCKMSDWLHFALGKLMYKTVI